MSQAASCFHKAHTGKTYDKGIEVECQDHLEL